jgi:hypothetical protein
MSNITISNKAEKDIPHSSTSLCKFCVDILFLEQNDPKAYRKIGKQFPFYSDFTHFQFSARNCPLCRLFLDKLTAEYSFEGVETIQKLRQSSGIPAGLEMHQGKSENKNMLRDWYLRIWSRDDYWQSELVLCTDLSKLP